MRSSGFPQFSTILLSLLVFSCSDEGTVTVNSNPVILSLSAEENILRVLDSTKVECSAVDPDGDKIIYEWFSIDGSISGHGQDIKWIAPSKSALYPLICRVSDANGGEDEAEIQFSVIGFDTLLIEDLSQYAHEFLDVFTAQTQVFHTVAQLDSFWYENVNCTMGDGTPCPPPDISFEDSSVVAVFWGNITSGCSQKRRSIKSMHIENDTIFVDVEYNFEDIFEICAAEIQPSHLVRFEKYDLPIKFIGEYPDCCNE